MDETTFPILIPRNKLDRLCEIAEEYAALDVYDDRAAETKQLTKQVRMAVNLWTD